MKKRDLIVLTNEMAGVPKWKTTALIDENKFFVPLGIFPNCKQKLLCIAWEGVEAHIYKKKLFVNADWIAEEYKNDQVVINFIRRWKEGVEKYFRQMGDL